MSREIDALSIATLRSLAIDMINNAKSGHPGMALGSAPLMYTLFSNHLISDPDHPDFINRDRFVLSAGHASSLLYATLHTCEYKISLDDLKNFRKLNSITPGHPEADVTPGVDCTSGPLGQGIAQAVGLAIAETHLRNSYPDGEKIINHYTYCLCGDGCLQEGISQEAISLAGVYKLNKLILFYDSNEVTLDGALSLSCAENTKLRFEAANWNYLEVKDGNDVDEIDAAIRKAKTSKDKPTIIKINTVIGYGSKKQGTNKVHGAPLGEEDGNYAKKEVYKFDYEPFYVPDSVVRHLRNTFNVRGKWAYNAYIKDFEEYSKDHPAEAKRFEALIKGDLSNYLPTVFPNVETGSSISTRSASQKALNAYYLALPNLIGGSADVASSVMTKIEGSQAYTYDNYSGRVLNFGIREFAMSSIANGILLHGGLRTYVGSFFVFSDYLKPAVRMSALSKLPNIYLFSHDSIAVGEDGPTHQPIEQLTMLRSIPNVNVIRPADEREVYGAYLEALQSKTTPTCIVLSRQNLPVLENSDSSKVKLGAYEVYRSNDNYDYILLATGSEVSSAIEVSKKLANERINTKVISMPSWELFDKQDKEYKNSVLDLAKDKIITLEMSSTFGWAKYGEHNLGIDTFGASSKASDVISYFGFDAESLYNKVLKIVK